MTDIFYVMLSIGIPFVILISAYYRLLRSFSRLGDDYFYATIALNKEKTDNALIQGQIKYWQQQYEDLKNKQQPRSKDGKYARKVK